MCMQNLATTSASVFGLSKDERMGVVLASLNGVCVKQTCLPYVIPLAPFLHTATTVKQNSKTEL